MKKLEKIENKAKIFSMILAIARESIDEFGAYIPAQVSDAEFEDMDSRIVGMKFENSEVIMLIYHSPVYVNQVNFKLSTVVYINYQDSVFPVETFIYPDGSLSNDLFFDTENYINKIFEEN